MSDTVHQVIHHNFGPVIYVEEGGAQSGCDDVFTKIELCRNWYAQCALGGAFLDPFIR